MATEKPGPSSTETEGFPQKRKKRKRTVEEETSPSPKKGKEKQKKTETSKEKGEKISPEKKVTRELEDLAEASRRVIEQFVELYEKTGNLSLAFSLLSTQIKEGTIKDLKQLSKVISWFEEKQKARGVRIDGTAKKATKAVEDSKAAVEAEKESGEAIKKFVDDYESNNDGGREVAEALAKQKELLRELFEQGITGMPPSARPPTYEEGKEDEHRDWFEEQLRRVEERDQSFSENWRMTLPIETFLSSLPIDKAKAQELYKELVQKFEDRRRLHDYWWLYGRSAGTDPILNSASILSTGAIERVINQEGVTNAMVKFEKLAEMIFNNKREISDVEESMAEAKKKGDKEKRKDLENEKDRLEERQFKMKDIMGKLMRGEIDYDEKKDLEIKSEDVEDKEEFEDIKAQNRLAGKLFIVLGFTASYDIDDFAAGDFFVARLIHLKNRFISQSREEGNRWYGRNKLWKRFNSSLWGTNYAGGLLDNIGRFKDNKTKKEKLAEFGLERVEEEQADGRMLTVLKIVDPSKLKKLDLKEFRIEKETSLVEWADGISKADQMRKELIGNGKYLDRPNMEIFLKMGEAMDHLKGDKRWQFFAGMYHDLADFHTGPGALDRLLKGKFWEAYTVKDDQGKVRFKGISFIRSDAEHLGLDKGWSAGEVHKMAEEAQRNNMISKSYTEQILRDKLSLVGIPGIGPVRFTKEILDYIGWGGLLAMIFAPFIEFFRNLGKQLESK
ncbi:MAG: hypothetical protein MUP45_03430 [Candidatus Marinimicrobia bacterium]|nr:hypothetical protein [Candidatus Neomarinimicrobiota bacterium]